MLSRPDMHKRFPFPSSSLVEKSFATAMAAVVTTSTSASSLGAVFGCCRAPPRTAMHCKALFFSVCPVLTTMCNSKYSGKARHLPFNRSHSSRMHQMRLVRQMVKDSASLFQPTVQDPEIEDEEPLPTPIVVIDQESDPDATVVELSFGDRLGALLDTMKALKDLGLNVVKSRMSVEGPITRKRFAITRADTGRKIDDPELLEAIRLSIINNMITYHPESSVQFALGNAFGVKAPTKKLDIDIATHIHISDDGPHRSLLFIETADRPGLLREIVKVLADVNIAFESGEFDTEGLVARAKFHVNYRGAALNKSLQQVITNCLHYYLRRPETNEDSY